MSAHKAREARRERLVGEAKERGLALACAAALLLSRPNSGDPRVAADRYEAIDAASKLLDEAEVFALAELDEAEPECSP